MSAQERQELASARKIPNPETLEQKGPEKCAIPRGPKDCLTPQSSPRGPRDCLTPQSSPRGPRDCPTPQSSPGQKMTKSMSLTNLNNNQKANSGPVDQDDILALTQQVKLFSDGLSHLKTVFTDLSGSGEDLRIMSHSRLGEVLAILKNILHKYPALQSTDLFSSSAALISKIKTHDYNESPSSLAEHNFCESIDQLALAFSSSVSEYLMGDLGNISLEKEGRADKTKSYGDLLKMEKNAGLFAAEQAIQDVMNPEEIDSVLLRLQAGVDLAMQRAKAWSKYMKEVTTYIEKKTQLETDYSKNILRLANSMLPVLSDEENLPLQSVFCTVISQDIEYATSCQATQTLIQSAKFVEPLTSRRNEHDKMRRSVKDTWVKEVKKMQEAVNSLRKSQSMYMMRKQDYEKAREQSCKVESDILDKSSSSSALSKMDKRRKVEEEAMHKAAEAETTYKACVAEANSKQQELAKTKSELLSKIREQIFLCDQVIKSVTMDYFDLLHTLAAPVPVQYQTLCEASKKYQPGSQFSAFVHRMAMSPTNAPLKEEAFVFEPFISTRETQLRKTSTQSSGSSNDLQLHDGSPLMDRYRVKAWGTTLVSESDSGSSRSVESSPSSSPHQSGRKPFVKSGSLDDLEETDGEATLLGLPSTEVDLQALLKRQSRRRNTTFGVDFQEQVEKSRSAIPSIVTKCLTEIEKRGILIKGIYRMSGVKSKVEALCSRFEKDPDSVNLDDEHPNVISNVLKLYLRQLPEPLLSFKLYSSFIQIAKDNMGNVLNEDETLSKLGDMASKLPYSNFKTCAMLMHHLSRIASHSSTNQMTASNLGIVFGPTLLRPLEGTGSLASLVDTPHQTRTVELLIINVKDIFGPETEYELIPAETPVEQLSVNGQSRHEKEPDIEETKDRSSRTKSSIEEGNLHLLTDNKSKASETDIVLPGSTDKKSTSPPAVSEVTLSDDNADVNFDDDFTDINLPDGSFSSQHANSSVSSTTCKGVELLARQYRLQSLPIKEEIQKVTRPIIMKPCPPQDLALSPESAKKMLVPSITIVESSPITESQPQMCYPLKPSDKSKFRTSALQNLKSIGPSLQSFVIATAKGLKANFPSSAKSDKSDFVKDKKSKTSPPLQRQSSSDSLSLSSIKNVLQKSPKLPRQSSLSEIKEKPHLPKGFKSLSEGSSDIPFESAKKITTAIKNEDSNDYRIEEDKGELDTHHYKREGEKSHSDQRDDPAAAEIASPETIRKKTTSYPTVTNTEFPVQKMTPPITRQTKVSFAIPEDSDSSSVSSGVSSLTSPWSSPQPKRPSLSRQKPIETEITVDLSRRESNEENNKSPHSLKNPEFMGKVEEISANSDTDQSSKSISAPKEEAPLLTVEGQPMSESESKFSMNGQANLPQSVVCDMTIQKDKMISEDQQGAVLENPAESSSATRQKQIQMSNISPIQETESKEESRNQLKPPNITPTGLSSSSSEGDIVNNILLKDEDVMEYKPSTDDTVKKASSSDCLHSDAVGEKGSPNSPRRPFKSSISSSALLLSSLSPVLPRGHTYYSHSLSSLNANSILAGNVPARPIRSTAMQSIHTPYTPLRSLSQSVPNLRDSRKRQTSAPPSFRQSLPETSFLEEEPGSSDSNVTSTSVEGLPRVNDIDGEPELNKKSLQIGAKSKEGPSRISTNPAVSRAKLGPKAQIQTSKPTRDSQRPPKGPSGIVMGKAAILPSRTGPRSATSPRKNGQSQEPKKPAGVTGTSEESGKKKSSPSRKPSAALATSESHNFSCATCGRRRSSATKLNDDTQNLSEKDKTNSERKLSASSRGTKTTVEEKKSTDSKNKPKLHKDRTPRFV
ncbi:rho GTPase-activating protein 45-like isoform X5 [Ostrea edulis]|uniref:rho GTPase-activating protein 45-like isoform X5 n=1 Tax=Ostrea edulis TaxID=37623 RepID=UPI0024AF5047|nr:rho GTPase-activating protein 45-like isoform X5 [Ostrea edulis]